MTDFNDDENDKPLDPAVAQVQQRLRRLMLISGLTLGVGMFAVFAAIVYRLWTYEPSQAEALPPDAATPTIARSALGLAADAELVSSAIDGDRLALTWSESGGSTVIVFQMPAMTVVSRLRVSAE